MTIEQMLTQLISTDSSIVQKGTSDLYKEVRATNHVCDLGYLIQSIKDVRDALPETEWQSDTVNFINECVNELQYEQYSLLEENYLEDFEYDY